jgi:carboxyl-terminal processing protease
MAVIFGVFLGLFFNFPNQAVALNKKGEREQKLRQIIDYIDYEYVDKVNTDSLLDQTISELLHHLDPHSTYIPEDQVSANEEAIRGSFVGIGIEFKIYKDSLTVVRVMENGPSAKAGLKAGDRIIKADSVNLSGEKLNSLLVVQTLKGEAGSTVDLTIFRASEGQERIMSVQRDDVDLNSVNSAFLVNDSTALIKLTKFTARSTNEVKSALRRLLNAGAKNVILDLRDNPGGLLSAAEQISDEFLAKGQMIVFTKSRDNQVEEFFAKRNGFFEKGQLVVLINRGSASASEIVAGALQDNKRAQIIGRRSFGKGLVQEEITLKDGSKMRLTTQRYYTPNGRSIQRDYDSREGDFYFHGNTGSLLGDSAVLLPDSAEFKGGRNEGGIQPDYEVGYDTAGTTRLLYHLAMTIDLDESAFRYVDARRLQLAQWSEDSFLNHWEADSAVFASFFGAPISERIAEADSIQVYYLANRLKAFIAYNHYGNEAYQKVYAQDDPYVLEALAALKEKE